MRREVNRNIINSRNESVGFQNQNGIKNEKEYLSGRIRTAGSGTEKSESTTGAVQNPLYRKKPANSTAVSKSGEKIIPPSKGKIETAVDIKSDAVQRGVNRDEIKSGSETKKARNIGGIKTFVLDSGRIKNKRYSVKAKLDSSGCSLPCSKTDIVQRRKEIYKRALRIKQIGLQNRRYVVANPDDGESPAINAAVAAFSAVSAGIHAGGMIHTAVKKTSGAIGHITSAVRHSAPLVRVGSAKDAGRIMTAAGDALKNAAADTGRQILKTKIDKSKITDTGTEAVKQGITDTRHVSNAGKAVVNAARTGIKTAAAVKNMPRDTRAQVRRIKRGAKRAANAAKKTVDMVKKAGTAIIKIASSKAGLIIVLALLLIVLTTTLLSGLTTVSVTTVTGLFSWLMPEDENSDKTVSEMLSGYNSVTSEYVSQKQAEIEAVVNGLEPEYITYPPYSEIQGLNRFGNSGLSVDESAVLAILAVQRFKELGESEELKLEFTDAEIQEAVENFYDFTYSYSYGECPGHDCVAEETQEVVNAGTPYEYVLVTVTYSCHGSHKYLDGSVTSLTAEQVMESLGFTDDENSLYYMYYGQISQMMNGG